MKNEIMTIPIEEMYEEAEPYMSVMCGYDREGIAAEKIKAKAMKVRSTIFDGTSIDVLISPFSPECVKEDYFQFEDTKIECSKLPNIDHNSIVGGYVFMFHAPMPDLTGLPISKVYVADSWQTSFVDSGRNFIRRKLLLRAQKEYEQKIYITDTIAPGMYGMAGTKVRKFFEFMDYDKIDLKILDSGMMSPVKSFVGIFLILNQNKMIQAMNCAECLSGHKSCEYCKNFAERYLA